MRRPTGRELLRYNPLLSAAGSSAAGARSVRGGAGDSSGGRGGSSQQDFNALMRAQLEQFFPGGLPNGVFDAPPTPRQPAPTPAPAPPPGTTEAVSNAAKQSPPRLGTTSDDDGRARDVSGGTQPDVD